MSMVPAPVTILQSLIRFDTTNPPGNEKEAVNYIRSLLKDAGIQSNTYALDADRPNLVSRIEGRGEAPPLLLYGHVDVVTTKNQQWTHPPFSAEIADGYIWGRGALDMKGPLAMIIAAFLRAGTDAKPPGDVILCVLSDEESMGAFGAGFMTEQHADQFEGVRHAISEFGGFSLIIGGRTFYPIMVAEKQVCWMRATIQGPGGHGSMPVRGGAMARLARFLNTLDHKRLPVHVTPSARLMFEGIARHLSFPQNAVIGGLLVPQLTDALLSVMGSQGVFMDTVLHNTVSPTGLSASDKVNVIPSQIAIDLDGRLLPGFTPDDIINELHAVAGSDVDYEIISYDIGPGEPDMTYFDTLSAILKEADPSGVPIPLLLPGVSDARFFARLGIQTYGFTPMKLPPDFNFIATIHAADERIPVDALPFGADAVHKAIVRYTG